MEYVYRVNYLKAEGILAYEQALFGSYEAAKKFYKTVYVDSPVQVVIEQLTSYNGRCTHEKILDSYYKYNGDDILHYSYYVAYGENKYKEFLTGSLITELPDEISSIPSLPPVPLSKEEKLYLKELLVDKLDEQSFACAHKLTVKKAGRVISESLYRLRTCSNVCLEVCLSDSSFYDEP